MQGILQQGDIAIPCAMTRTPKQKAKSMEQLNGAWTIPGNHEACVTVPWQPEVQGRESFGMIEPLADPPEGVLISRLLVDTGQSVV